MIRSCDDGDPVGVGARQARKAIAAARGELAEAGRRVDFEIEQLVSYAVAVEWDDKPFDPAAVLRHVDRIREAQQEFAARAGTAWQAFAGVTAIADFVRELEPKEA